MAAASTWPRPSRSERGHEEDAAADAEEAGEHPGGQPEQHGQEDRRAAHAAISQIPSTTSSAANPSEQRPARDSLLEPGACQRADRAGHADEQRVLDPHLAAQRVQGDAGEGGDDDRAERGRPSPRAPRSPASRTRSGTITIPPPTPKSELKVPATSPIAISRHTGVIV